MCEVIQRSEQTESVDASVVRQRAGADALSETLAGCGAGFENCLLLEYSLFLGIERIMVVAIYS